MKVCVALLSKLESMVDAALHALAGRQAHAGPSCSAARSFSRPPVPPFSSAPGPTDPPTATVTLTSPAAKPKRSVLSLPPAPVQHSTRAPQHHPLPPNAHATPDDWDAAAAAAALPHPLSSSCPVQRPSQLVEIKDEGLYALAASQDNGLFADVPDSVADPPGPSKPGGRSVISLPSAPHQHRPSVMPHSHQMPHEPSRGATAGQLYAQEPAEPFEPEFEEEPSREWTLPALNPLDIDGSVMPVVCGGQGGMRVYCRLRLDAWHCKGTCYF